ncbi:MAG: hypothetical protein LBO79_02165 [Zoogloeaceae bacterium]|jgi:hypothetical protein|nr:hypothetical protein [Zoogloeaceae bacterium]
MDENLSRNMPKSTQIHRALPKEDRKNQKEGPSTEAPDPATSGLCIGKWFEPPVPERAEGTAKGTHRITYRPADDAGYLLSAGCAELVDRRRS